MAKDRRAPRIGLLLAAGRGLRFDPQGRHNKLLQTLADGQRVAQAAARALGACTDKVLAVIPPNSPELAALLQVEGCALHSCEQAHLGMGVSLASGLRAARARGWLAAEPGAEVSSGDFAPADPGFALLIALADMPYVQPATGARLLAAVDQGAPCAYPVFGGQRGNPVAFGASCIPELLRLNADQGARALLRAAHAQAINVTDPGVLIDIDRPADLEKGLP